MLPIQFTYNHKKYNIGKGYPTWIIAELSANHNTDLERALLLLESAAQCGVDAVKLQTYTAKGMTVDSKLSHYQIHNKDSPWYQQNLFELYQKASTPWHWYETLNKKAKELGVVLFSTPFDEDAVDFLETFDMPIYKVSSFEIHHYPLLEKIGKTKKPVIISTGIASDEDIELALKTLKENGATEICLLHCISSYPAQPKEMNLKNIPRMEQLFQTNIGLSDHSLTISIPCAAVALGATVIEKHFTWSRTEKTPDQEFSLEPLEFKNLVDSIRDVDAAISDTPVSKPTGFFGRSILCTRNIQKGETLDSTCVDILRPAIGLHPKYLKGIIGKKVSRDLIKGHGLQWSDISEIES